MMTFFGYIRFFVVDVKMKGRKNRFPHMVYLHLAIMRVCFNIFSSVFVSAVEDSSK